MTSAEAAGESLADVLADTLRAMLRREAGRDVLRDADGARIWAQMAGMSVPWLGVDSAAGGEGGTLSDVVAALVVCGEFAVPLPIAQTLFGSWLLAQAGLKVPRTALAVVDPDGRTTQPDARWWVIQGREGRVGLAARGTLLTVLPDVAGEQRAVVVPPVDVSWGARAVDPGAAEARAAIGRAALLAGAARRAVDLAVRHCVDRHQFGRPIGAFQVVQHMLARAAAGVALVSVAVESAAVDPTVRSARAAKLVAARTARDVAAICHQVHGAIGMTQEHDLHFVTLRLQAWQEDDGAEAGLAVTLGRELLEAEADPWDHLLGA